ncbi:MAG: chloride channel protein [candidate division FCPU426 bacterium]
MKIPRLLNSIQLKITGWLNQLWSSGEFHLIGRWIFFGFLIGLVGGFGAWLFRLLLELSQNLFTEAWLHRLAPSTASLPGTIHILWGRPWWWLIPLIPALGGLISGVLVFWIAPEAEGHGTDAVIDSFHRGRGLIRARVPLVKTLASAAVIGSGGSAGREGPIAQIGAGFGSLLGRWLKVSIQDRRLMVLAGAAAGISAIFQAPLGAALFVTEVLYRNHELETEALIPAIIASLTSFSLYIRLVGQEQLFVIPQLHFHAAEELVVYAGLGLACALMGSVYVRCFYGLRDRFFKPLPLPAWLKPALGGLLLGLLVLFLPQVWGGGYNVMQQAMSRSLTAHLMLLLVVGKILATSFTISSGGSGGVFAPSLFIGAMLGGGLGASLQGWLPPSWMPDPTALVVVGMGGFFAGVAKVPIASIILVAEMTGGYGLLIPMMLVSAIAVLFNHRVSLYERQAASTIDSPAHQGDFIADLLEGLTIADTKALRTKPVTVLFNTPLAEILDKFSGKEQHLLPMVTKQNVVKGVIAFEDLRELLLEGEWAPKLILAVDIAKFPFPFVTPEQNLHQAITEFARFDSEELPVLDAQDHRLLGMLTKREVFFTYEQKLETHKARGKQAGRRGRFV